MSGKYRQLGQLDKRWAYHDDAVNQFLQAVGSFPDKPTKYDRSKVAVQQNETGEFAIRLLDVVDDAGAHLVGGTCHVCLYGGYSQETEQQSRPYQLARVAFGVQGAGPTPSEVILGFGFPTMAFDYFILAFETGNPGTGNPVFDYGVRVHREGCAHRNFAQGASIIGGP